MIGRNINPSRELLRQGAMEALADMPLALNEPAYFMGVQSNGRGYKDEGDFLMHLSSLRDGNGQPIMDLESREVNKLSGTSDRGPRKLGFG